MGLKERLEADLKEAMKARDERRVGAIRLLRANIANYEIARTDRKNQDYGKPITEEDLLGVLRKELSQRREALQFAEQAGRSNLVEKERAELAALEPYMPRQLDKDEIRAEVEPLVAEHGRDFRKVMPLASQKLRARAEGRLVNEVVRELTQ
ncbi:MAG TPA: GatB/YqeY domain-containing protein [Chloroflexota bacterium]|nr:GatB/YqeY domain-containing protein [Chloroflexota bacterium]